MHRDPNICIYVIHIQLWKWNRLCNCPDVLIVGIYIYTHVSRKLLKVAKCLANCAGARMDGLSRFLLTLSIIWRNHCQGNAHGDNQREKETLLILTSVALKLAPLRCLDIRMSRLRADLWRRHNHVASLAGARFQKNSWQHVNKCSYECNHDHILYV